jgi:sec-independent protein translocase protein TatA
MGDIGVPELIVILVIALVVFGPGRLPEIGRSLGRSLRAFREATREGGGPAALEGGRPGQDGTPQAGATQTDARP